MLPKTESNRTILSDALDRLGIVGQCYRWLASATRRPCATCTTRCAHDFIVRFQRHRCSWFHSDWSASESANFLSGHSRVASKAHFTDTFARRPPPCGAQIASRFRQFRDFRRVFSRPRLSSGCIRCTSTSASPPATDGLALSRGELSRRRGPESLVALQRSRKASGQRRQAIVTTGSSNTPIPAPSEAARSLGNPAPISIGHPAAWHLYGRFLSRRIGSQQAVLLFACRVLNLLSFRLG